jgi:hypothetical protein
MILYSSLSHLKLVHNIGQNHRQWFYTAVWHWSKLQTCILYSSLSPSLHFTRMQNKPILDMVWNKLAWVTVMVTVTVNLFKCPKNKRPRWLPPDIRLSQLHLELPCMQNVIAHGTPPRSGAVAESLIRFLECEPEREAKFAFTLLPFS